MAIGIEGQYSLKFSISNNEDYEDFIAEPDLVTFKIIEEAGNLLPTFELIFYTDDSDIFFLLHDGNNMDCQFGSDQHNDNDTASLTVTKITTYRSGKDKRVIHVIGIYAAIPYITNAKIFNSEKKSAVEVLYDVAVSNFGKKSVITNITKSKDSQVWRQHSISDKKFTNELWLHANVPDSFLAIGITTFGKFIMKDIANDSGPESWKFVPHPANQDNEVTYDGNPVLETNTGFINSWMGYGRELNALDLDTSFDSKILEVADPMIALSSKMAKRIHIDKTYAGNAIQNENVDPEYWQSYMRNLAHLASFQNVKLSFTVTGPYKKYQILDKVHFAEGDVKDDGSSSEFSSGVYYITKLARSISHRILTTTVVLSRESINNVKASV